MTNALLGRPPLASSAAPIASLAMYDQPWLTAANDALWAAVARHLRAAGMTEVPARLQRATVLDTVWRDPGLLLAQTCGYPLATALGDAVTVVAAPVYNLPGCTGARHRSAIVVASDSRARALGDLTGGRAAINGWDSNSGMNLFRHAVAPLATGGRFFGSVTVTGSHMASLEAVAKGAVDLAAIDCVTHGLATRHRPDLTAGTRVLAWTAESPALPFITHAGAAPGEVAMLRDALQATVRDPANAAAISALALTRIEPASAEDYAVLLDYERQAVQQGYPVLA